MKNYKFILSIFSILILGLFLMVTYWEIPTPHKKVIKSLDINNVYVK